MAQTHRQRARVRTPGAVAAPRRSGNGQGTMRRERAVGRPRDEGRDERGPGRLRALGWRPITALVLSIAGLGDALYLTVEHFTGNHTLVCSASSVVNCEKVTTSPESYVFGIPVALLGAIFFVAMLVVNLPQLWRASQQWIVWLRLGMVVGGMGFVIYLLYSELFSIKAICLWCTGVHVVTFLLFVLVVSSLPALSTARE